MRCLNVSLLGLLGLVFAHLAFAEAAQSEPPPLELCLAAAADYSPVYRTQIFPSTTKEVAAVFRLREGESYKKMTSTWIAVDVGGAAPPNYKIAEGDLQEQKDRGVFRLTGLQKPMPIGKYRLDVTADGKPWHSVEFTVAAGDKPIDTKRPQELFPLADGKVWTYAFVQEPGEGAKITLPGITPDADGKLRATVTITVAETTPAGAHMELRRNTDFVFEEWWQLSEAGLSALKRHQVGDEWMILDPPQVLLPWPLDTPKTWTYEAKDKLFKQTYRLWGPVPVKGAKGEAPGYVVLTEQGLGPGINLTAERHFIPGLGLVREVIVTALNGSMLSRQEMVLKDAP